MISKILKDLVESYQESQYVNYSRDISFFAARRELLSNGTVSFFDPGTTQPKCVTHKGCISVLPNPIMADSEGRFPEVDGEGSYKVRIASSNGLTQLSVDPLDSQRGGKGDKEEELLAFARNTRWMEERRSAAMPTNEPRTPAGKAPSIPQGIDEFKILEREWERQIEDIIIGMAHARTDQGILIAKIDPSKLIAEYTKLVDEARNKVEHGVLHTGLRADVPKDT